MPAEPLLFYTDEIRKWNVYRLIYELAHVRGQMHAFAEAFRPRSKDRYWLAIERDALARKEADLIDVLRRRQLNDLDIPEGPPQFATVGERYGCVLGKHAAVEAERSRADAARKTAQEPTAAAYA